MTENQFFLILLVTEDVLGNQMAELNLSKAILDREP